MANENTVLARLRHWADDSAPDPELLPLCLAGLDSLRARLRDGAEEDNPRVISAAAAIALYQYQLRQRLCGGALSGFKAGDLTLKSAGDPLEAAIRLRDDCLAEAAPLLRDGAFVFLTV